MPDRCPFHRAFSGGFQDCAAFQPAEYVGVDLEQRAARPVATCRYLEVGTAESGEYYPACALGTREHREAWAARLKAERMDLFGQLQTELGAAIRPRVVELVEAKARRLEPGGRHAEEDGRAVAELVRLAMLQVDAVLERRRPELRQLGVAPDACRDLVEWILLQVGWGDDLRFPTLGEEQLRGAPAGVAELLIAFRG